MEILLVHSQNVFLVVVEVSYCPALVTDVLSIMVLDLHLLIYLRYEDIDDCFTEKPFG